MGEEKKGKPTNIKIHTNKEDTEQRHNRERVKEKEKKGEEQNRKSAKEEEGVEYRGI